MTAAWPALPTTQYKQVTFSPVDQRGRYDALGALPRANGLASDQLYAVSFDIILSGTDLATFWTWFGTTAAGGAEKISGLEGVIGDDPSILYSFAELPNFKMLRSGNASSRRYRATFTMIQVGLGAAIQPSGTVAIDSASGSAAGNDVTPNQLNTTVSIDSSTAVGVGSNVLEAVIATLDAGTATGAGSNVTLIQAGNIAIQSGTAAGAGTDLLMPSTAIIDTVTGAAVASDVLALYGARAVNFDGTNDYLARGAALTGIANGKTFTFSAWLRRTSNIETKILLARTSTSNRVFCAIDSAGVFHMSFNNSTPATICNIQSAAVWVDANWHHIMLSFDLSDSSKRHLWVDGVQSLTVTTYTNDTIDFAGANNWWIGTTQVFTDKYIGDMAEFYMATSYLDLSNATNRAAFLANSYPTYLGSDGSRPTGSQPLICLNAASTASWNTNAGSGGGFTVTGALSDGTGFPHL